MQKLNKDHSSTLKQKLLSVELIRDRQIHDLTSLDFFSQTNKEPMKLLYRVTNSWLLNDLCKDLFSLLEDYDLVFGDCHNKLRLMLDFTSICFKMSFVFVSDVSFPERLRRDVLVKAGDRAAQRIMEEESFEPPFSLQNKVQIEVGKTNILEVIQKFTKNLKKQQSTHLSVLDSHLATSESNPSLFYFSQRMG